MTADLATWGFVAARLALETLLLAGMTAGIARFVHRAATRRSLWQCALVGIAIICAVDLLDLRPTWPKATHRRISVTPASASAAAQTGANTESTLTTQPSIHAPREIAQQTAATAVSESTTPDHSVVWPGLLWITGTAMVLGNVLLARLRLARWIRSLPRLETPGTAKGGGSANAGLSELGPSLSTSILRVVESPELCGPVAFGVWRPTIALPTQFSRRFTSSQRDAMVAHELAHLRGRDPLWCLLADVLCAITWWHPAVWWVRDRFRAAAESAADAAAASTIDGGHVALAEALVILGRDLVDARGLRGLGMVGSGFRSQLAHRVTQLLDARHSASSNSSKRFRSWMAVGSTLAVAGACLATPWPGAPSLGLRSALLQRGAAVVVNHDPSVSPAEIRRSAPATLESMSQDPQFGYGTVALADANSRAGDAPAPGSSTPSEPLEVTAQTNQPITLEMKFAEIVERGSDDLGLDWLFGQSPTNNAPLVAGGPTNLPAQEETLRGRGLRVDVMRTEGQAVRLGPKQFAALLDRLKSRGGLDLMATPRVITFSGQQARIDIKEARTLVTDVDVTRPADTNAAPAVNYQTEKLFVGQSVDLVPELAGDEVRLRVTASVTEFLGYDQPKAPGSVQAPGAEPLTYQEPLPRVRVRQTVADGITGAQPAVAKAGETIILRGPLVTEVQRNVDKVAVLGDLPLLGRLFRQESTNTVRKRLYLFVTPSVDSQP
ncbi:MAG: hypothetical protein IT581_22330 [Verrucomicrobiales bacterium]|nr:hypothetical protein [Verrucomicrobiales bacterium]